MLVAIISLAVLHANVTGSYTFSYEALLALRSRNTCRPVLPGIRARLCDQGAAVPVPHVLPDAHVEAPTAGSVILAGVLLKMGTYGLLASRFPCSRTPAVVFAPYVAGLAVIGIYTVHSWLWCSPDMKKLVAYSSVSHLGFVCWVSAR